MILKHPKDWCVAIFEMFDAVIVLTSFSLDLVFIEGITGPQSEEAIALLVIFLLWRILRIINGKILAVFLVQYGQQTTRNSREC